MYPSSVHVYITVAIDNFFFRWGRVPIKNFLSHVHHGRTIVRNENIFFFGDGPVTLILLKLNAS